MSRVITGCVFVVIGIVLALVGQPALGSDLHPVTTGLIAIGLVSAGVGIAERRLDAQAGHSPVVGRRVR